MPVAVEYIDLKIAMLFLDAPAFAKVESINLCDMLSKAVV